MANKLINMAVRTSTFGAELLTSDNASAARVLLGVDGGGGGGQVASVNGQVGAVVLGYADVGAASAAQGAKADTALQPGDATGAITSVNGKTGVVNLTASDVGAATAAQGAKADTALQPGDIPAPAVSSVNGKTGAVNLAPADIGAATSAQGLKADSAVQPGSLATVATTGSYNNLTGLPTLGTAASKSAADFATAAQGALADTAVQPAALSTKQDVPGAWVAITAFSNGWSNRGGGTFNDAQYRKAGDRVELRGFIQNTSSAAAGVIFTLPAGYRPPRRTVLCTLASALPSPAITSFSRVDAYASGDISLTTLVGSDGARTSIDYLVLDGLSFPTV